MENKGRHNAKKPKKVEELETVQKGGEKK